VPLVLRCQTAAIAKNRSHKGLVTALQCLLGPILKRLDIGALFHGCRLYGDVNSRCKSVLRTRLPRLKRLTHVNLQSKCDDEMLVQLAKNCANLEDLQVPMSDITDAGLMALCGVSVCGKVGENDGCRKLSRIGVYNCINITLTGVGCILRNLESVVSLSYDKLADAVETVAKIDPDFILGKRTLKITHMDQFSEYYDFSSHADMLQIILRVCPRLDSLRFYVSDDSCEVLSRVPGIRHLQLEMEDVGNGFRQLAGQYGALASLQLTFRTMASSQLADIAENCPLLSVLRLIGYEIVDSQNLSPRRNAFKNLRVVDLRLMRGGDELMPDFFELGDGDGPAGDNIDTVTPQLLHFLLDHTVDLEELTVQAVANFMNDSFLMSLTSKNPLLKLKRLRISVTPATSLKIGVARYLIENLPELNLISLSRWNIPSRLLRQLIAEIKTKNYNLTIA